jgi:hypothetical protein
VGEDATSPDMVRYTVPEAAQVLGISPEAVRNRLSRGTLRSEKVEGRVHVLLARPDRSQPIGDVSADIPTDMVEELRDRIRYLERQVEEERAARFRADQLLARLMERVPELEAPSTPESPEPREEPEVPPIRPERAEPAGPVDPQREEPERVEPQRVEPRESPVTATNEQQGGGPIPGTGGTQEPSERRPWWRRLFGG